MTIEKVTNYVTIKINKYVTYFNEVAEYREAFAEGRTVYEPSKLEIVRPLPFPGRSFSDLLFFY